MYSLPTRRPVFLSRAQQRINIAKRAAFYFSIIILPWLIIGVVLFAWVQP